MNRISRLAIVLGVALCLQGCVVVTFTGEGSLERVPTADVPSHLAAVLGQSSDSSDRRAK